jgi:hypothetical protein
MIDMGDDAEVANFGLRHWGEDKRGRWTAGQRDSRQQLANRITLYRRCRRPSPRDQTAPLPRCPARGS